MVKKKQIQNRNKVIAIITQRNIDGAIHRHRQHNEDYSEMSFGVLLAYFPAYLLRQFYYLPMYQLIEYFCE